MVPIAAEYLPSSMYTPLVALHDQSEALRDNPEVQRAYLGA